MLNVPVSLSPRAPTDHGHCLSIKLLLLSLFSFSSSSSQLHRHLLQPPLPLTWSLSALSFSFFQTSLVSNDQVSEWHWSPFFLTHTSHWLFLLSFLFVWVFVWVTGCRAFSLDSGMHGGWISVKSIIPRMNERITHTVPVKSNNKKNINHLSFPFSLSNTTSSLTKTHQSLVPEWQV